MKIGRNDPCPCNSKLKFKKCCLLKMDAVKELEDLEWQEWFKKDQAIGQANLDAANTANTATPN